MSNRSHDPFAGAPAKKKVTEEEKANELPKGTSKEILEWVGEDKERAERAMREEVASDKPRNNLIDPLEEIIGD